MPDDASDCRRIQQQMAEEDSLSEKTDEHGDRWHKVYLGGGEHFKNWLAQAEELGEVQIEEVNFEGLQCFEQSGQKMYRIWVKEGTINDPI